MEAELRLVAFDSAANRGTSDGDRFDHAPDDDGFERLVEARCEIESATVGRAVEVEDRRRKIAGWDLGDDFVDAASEFFFGHIARALPGSEVRCADAGEPNPVLELDSTSFEEIDAREVAEVRIQLDRIVIAAVPVEADTVWGEPFAYEGCPGNEPLAHELEKDRVATGRLSFQIDDERCSAPEDIVTGVSEFCCDLVRFAVGREVTCLAIEREKPGAVGLVD
jgi:hypothetical protein